MSGHLVLDPHPTLLLVDDDPGSLRLMNKTLEADYDIRFATSGAQAIELLASMQPDLILLDMVMPEMDGIAVLQHLEHQQATRDIPVLFVTACSDAATESLVLRIGADDFIHKPINPDVLKARVANHLEQTRLRCALEQECDWLDEEVRARTRKLQDERDHLEERVAERTAELHASKQQLELALEAANLGIWSYDAASGQLEWNPRHSILLGIPETRCCGTLRDLRTVIHPHDRRLCLKNLHRILHDPTSNFDQIYRARWPDGRERWLHSLGKSIDNGPGRVVGTTRDITALKAHQQQLEHLAHYDALTALPNRILFSERLHHAMASARRRKLYLGVVYIDLDGFKDINDTYGHAVGDQLLIAVAQQMRKSLREVDTLARLGGDEFAALLIDLPDLDASTRLLERLLAAASQPLHLDDELCVQVTVSLGISCHPPGAEISDTQLLQQADAAMYQAKQAGKNRYQFYARSADEPLGEPTTA